MERLTTPQGTFELERYPVRKNETLRAWDAAETDRVLQFGLAMDRLDATAAVAMLKRMADAPPLPSYDAERSRTVREKLRAQYKVTKQYDGTGRR